ncbi:MAG: hypothetical protein HY517_04695 [Candidatus Aenigmarchaeota archaeon]|nr:hypothetical protein [Candidatus Aenigmarchaeota archaeon]
MDIQEKLEKFIREYYYSDLLKALKEEQHALVVDFSILDRYDALLADELLEQPERVIAIFNTAAASAADSDERINLRVRNLPESRNIRIRNLRAMHLNRLWTVSAVIRGAGEVKPQIYEAIFECPDCKAKISVIQNAKILQKPSVCECGRRGDFTLVDKKMIDVRWLKAQEPFEVTSGEQPGEIGVTLKEDLTTPRMQKKTDPGSNLTIVGILKEVPKHIKGKLGTNMDMIMEANHVETSQVEFEELEITPEDERVIKELASNLGIYDMLRSSIAPGIYGFDEIKDAVVLQLFGGQVHILPDNSRIRGNIHILVTGDPSVGKTQLLKLVSAAVPRGRYVSGTGASGAGLCTTYNSLIQLEDGSILKIGDLVERYSDILKQEDKGIYCAEVDGPKIMSFDQDSFKIKPLNITHVWKIKSPDKLVKVTSRSGKELIVTKDNPMPIIKNGEIIWKSASNLATGDFLATPRKLVYSPKNASILPFLDKKARIKNCSSVVLPLLEKIKAEKTIKEVVSDTGVSESGLYWFWKHEQGAPTLKDLMKVSENIGMNLEELMPEEVLLTQQMGHTIKLPKNLNESIMYLFGLIAGDGDIQKTSYGGYSLRFHSADEDLLKSFSNIASSEFNIIPDFYKHPEKIAYSRLNSKIIGEIAKKLGMNEGKKSHSIHVSEELSSLPNYLIAAYLRGLFDTDGYVNCRTTKGSDSIGFTTVSREFAYGILMLLLRFGINAHIRKRPPTLSFIRERKVQSGEKYEIGIRGKSNILNFRRNIGFRLQRKAEKLHLVISKISNENTNIDIVPEIGKLLRDARLASGLISKDIFGRKNYEFEKGRINPSRNMLSKIVSRIEPKNDFSRRLELFISSDIFWDEVKSVEEIDGEDFVYDVTVEKEHSFVANGLIMHNTATVTKNEALGTWMLEAGALILCNKGLIAIDEFDKMNRDDQIAMHEATSVESVSIAKASIVATLPAQTAVLAGANPKLGRFDPYMSIGEQINIPETLLSRFDLKFALRDQPNRAQDEQLADHVITSRTRPDKIMPAIPLQFLRKFIAYAKQITSMELSEEAANMLKNFYVDMRNRYASADKSAVAITLRQYEALIRLAEASARVRLDTVVRVQDAERAIRLMTASMKQLGYDLETQTFDVDRLEGGVTSSKRTKINRLLKILDELQKEAKEVALDDLKAEAENQGIENVDEVVEWLDKEGMVMYPRPGFIRKI